MPSDPFIAEMNKILGAEIIVSAEDISVLHRYTTGSLSLDLILGGGFPANLWTEIIGNESSGKTATVLKTIAANQAADPSFKTFWVASEHFDSDQARSLGVDLSRVTVARTQIMEAAFESMIRAIEGKSYNCIVLDSYPALIPAEEKEKGMDEYTMAAGARIFNKFIRKAGAASIRSADGCDQSFFGLIINQWRDAPGVFSRGAPPKTTPGGKGKNYFFYCRLEVARTEWITEKRPGLPDPFIVGQTTKFKTTKNKSAAPQQTAMVDFYFRSAPFLGFQRGDYDVAKEYANTALALGLITRAGAYYRFNGQQWNGKEALYTALRSDLSFQAELQQCVLATVTDSYLSKENS